jgi:hypothetical protein
VRRCYYAIHPPECSGDTPKCSAEVLIAELGRKNEALRRERDSFAEDLDTLETDVDEYLPTYFFDRGDGDTDEANTRERVEYAGSEITGLKAALRKYGRHGYGPDPTVGYPGDFLCKGEPCICGLGPLIEP